jgi:MSHA pilin protein MshA
MQKSQHGFTLVELVVVIVLLGILGVTALGKYQDLSADATTAANAGIASEISAAAAINYAAYVVNAGSEDVTIDSGTACAEADVQGLFATGAFPTDYDIGTQAGACAAAGDTYTCQVSAESGLGTAATATLICTGG